MPRKPPAPEPEPELLPVVVSTRRRATTTPKVEVDDSRYPGITSTPLGWREFIRNHELTYSQFREKNNKYASGKPASEADIEGWWRGVLFWRAKAQ